MSSDFEPPEVLYPGQVGTYPVVVKAGGGFVWDAVLEYRVWCHPERGALDIDDGNDYFRAFPSLAEAQAFAAHTAGAEDPIALILQEEWIDEPQPEAYEHKIGQRLTEWPLEFLRRPRRTSRTIPDFLAPDAPPDRLAILRGQAPKS